MNIIRITAATLALIFAFEIGDHMPMPSHSAMINIYENEDLSDSPYSEPISTLTFAHSAGIVCYANDKSGIDRTQYYANCNDISLAGANILPYN